MKFKVHYLLLASAMFLANCSDDIEQTIEEPGNEAIYPPVETGQANTTYTPAFAGQTRVNGVKTQTPFTSTVLTSSLASPWGITSLPDGRLLITQKGGTMRIVTNSGAVGNAITGIPAVNSTGQGGLLGICIDPQFSSNRMIYWVFFLKM